MTFGDPLFLFCYRQTREELCASIRSWRDVKNTAENVGDFESEQTEGHVGEAVLLLWKLGHVWFEIHIVHVERLCMI
jgi:hypothetical protein